jgi:tetratricopeptide (TPR) repeat protein
LWKKERLSMATVAAAFELAARSLTEGKLSLAEQFSWSVLREQPNHAETLHLLGLIALQKGNTDLAIDYMNRSLICDSSSAVSWKNLGDIHLAAGDCRAAVANYEQALRLQPDFADAYNHLGVALQRSGEWERAVLCHRQAVSLFPHSAQFYNNLGNALRGQGMMAEAASAFGRALELQPDSAELAYNLGTTLHEQGELDLAVSYYRRALRHRPDYADASNNLATAYKEQGLLDEAIAQFRGTLQLNPDHAVAYYNLSELAAAGKYSFEHDELERIKAVMAGGRCSAMERSLCGFALGSALNKQGVYDEAFRYYREANELRKPLLEEQNNSFDARAHEDFVDRIIAAHDREYFERVRGWGTETDLPIFIVGMPRSGSTLVEQILASHPRVFGAGELGEIPQFLANLGSNVDLIELPLVSDHGAARDLAADYLKHLTALGKGAGRVTVKTLENYLHLGVIATLFPRARIIHCRRHPLDVCLSCYFQNFNHVNFAWSLEDIGAYYRAYTKLMAHWSGVLPVAVHELRYEDLIHHQETVTRDLLAYCGLEWNERCLAFFKTRRVVRTASNVQVRKPISVQAIGRWKHYRSHLGPLFRALGRTLESETQGHSDRQSQAGVQQRTHPICAG